MLLGRKPRRRPALGGGLLVLIRTGLGSLVGFANLPLGLSEPPSSVLGAQLLHTLL